MWDFARSSIALFLSEAFALVPGIPRRSAWDEFLSMTRHPQSKIRPSRLGEDFIELAISTDYFIITLN